MLSALDGGCGRWWEWSGTVTGMPSDTQDAVLAGSPWGRAVDGGRGVRRGQLASALALFITLAVSMSAPLLAPPTASADAAPSFTVSPSSTIYNRSQVTFDASGTPVIGQALYAWDFGDGETTNFSDDPQVTEIFSYPGTYTVTLTVLDDNTSRTRTATGTMHVLALPPTIHLEALSRHHGPARRRRLFRR